MSVRMKYIMAPTPAMMSREMGTMRRVQSMK